MITRTLRSPGPRNRTTPRAPTALRLGTVALVAGLICQVPLGVLHPHREYANDSVAAFHEYARSGDWVLVHMGQFLGLMLATIGLVAMATYLGRQRGPAGFLGQVAVVMAVVSAAVFAVQMAVDGVALKAAVDTWDAATATADATTAYRVAESVRSVEKGLSALFNLINGLTLLSLGAGLSHGQRPRAQARLDRGGGGGRLHRRGRPDSPNRVLPRGHVRCSPSDRNARGVRGRDGLRRPVREPHGSGWRPGSLCSWALTTR